MILKIKKNIKIETVQTAILISKWEDTPAASLYLHMALADNPCHIKVTPIKEDSLAVLEILTSL